MSRNRETDAIDAAPADRLGRYELIERIAVGGMGEVFLARERSVAGVSRIVVVKRLLPQLAEDPEQVALFIDEARITSQLAHPNIAQIYEFGVDNGVHFLAMEYVPGKDLAHLCERAARLGTPMPRELAVYAVAEVARGLHFAHSAKDEHGRALHIIHRDISPHNVLVSNHGDVKLMDFGIATASIRRQRTATGVLRGKFAYMSPEQAEQKPLDARSDIFSAGVLLWETTLGRRLFAAPTELETIRRVSEAKVTPPREIEPDYPEGLQSVVMKALAFAPEDRFPSAAAFESALRAQLQSAGSDRRALGAWVNRLTPEAAQVEELAARMTEPVTATAAVSPRVTVSTGRRVTGPVAQSVPPDLPSANTVVRPLEDTTGASGAALGQSQSRQRVSTTRVLSISMVAAVVVAGLSYAGIRALRGSGEAPSQHAGVVTADAGVAPTDGAVIAAAPVDARPARVATAPPDAAASPLPHRRRPVVTPPRTRRTPPVAPMVDAGTRRVVAAPTRRPDAAPPVKPRAAVPSVAAKGKLAVDAQPWGTVTIDGKSRGTNPVQVSLAPGPHRVSVRLSGGGGIVSTTATVVSGKKTKCRATSSSLVCRPPR